MMQGLGNALIITANGPAVEGVNVGGVSLSVNVSRYFSRNPDSYRDRRKIKLSR